MSCSCKLFAVHLLFDVITEQINDDDDDDDISVCACYAKLMHLLFNRSYSHTESCRPSVCPSIRNAKQ